MTRVKSFEIVGQRQNPELAIASPNLIVSYDVAK